MRTYEKIRVFQVEGPGWYLVYLVLYLARELIGKLLLSLIKHGHIKSLERRLFILKHADKRQWLEHSLDNENLIETEVVRATEAGLMIEPCKEA